MAAEFPHLVSGRVTEETFKQITEAYDRFTATEGALVRAALEDYMPRFLANAGRPQHAELFAKLTTAIEERPEIAAELQTIARKATRNARRKQLTSRSTVCRETVERAIRQLHG